MSMLKKNLNILLLIAMVFVVAACGSADAGNESSNKEEGSTDSQNNQELTIDFKGNTLTAEDVFKLGELPKLGIVHTEEKAKIAMTVSSLEFPVFKVMKEFAEISAKADGNEFIFVNGENDLAKQEAAIDNFISQQVDVVIINAVNPPAQGNSINKLIEAGIKVVALDRAIEDERVYHVLGNDVQEGRNAANTIVEALDGKGKVVHITGQPGVSHANDNKKGFLEVMSEQSGIEIVAEQSGNYQRDKTFNVVQDILNANPSGTIDALFAHNDNSALGAVTAIEAAGRSDEIIVIGGDAQKDAIEAIEAGSMYGSNDRSPSIMGATAYQVAAAILNGKKGDLPFAVLIPPVMITKDSLERANDPFLALERHEKVVLETLEDYQARQK